MAFPPSTQLDRMPFRLFRSALPALMSLPAQRLHYALGRSAMKIRMCSNATSSLLSWPGIWGTKGPELSAQNLTILRRRWYNPSSRG